MISLCNGRIQQKPSLWPYLNKTYLQCKRSCSYIYVWMQVMHFLLEKGADATLCNDSRQTALHVSQPDLQKKLFAAMLRRLAHRAQLLEVAWRGDIYALQRLLVSRPVSDFHFPFGRCETRNHIQMLFIHCQTMKHSSDTLTDWNVVFPHWPSVITLQTAPP